MAGIRRWILVVALFVAGCGDGAALDRLAAGEQGRVTQVRSGDVVALDSGLVVRLAGIETPYEGEPGAEAARADLSRRVLGRQVQLLYGGAHRDAYGRALAQMRVASGRAWVQGALLSDGWARVRTYGDNRALAQVLYSREARARTAKRGLWALPAYRVLLPQEVTGDTAGFTIVEGRVLRATRTWSGVLLDFTNDRAGFVVLVPAEAAHDFEAAGKAPASLVGRLVRVRGSIDRDGLMRIDHPEPVELLRDR